MASGDEQEDFEGKAATNEVEDAIKLPHHMSLLKYVSARATEICALTQLIDRPEKTVGALQQLPQHLRRRAASHNPKRLPARIRQLAGTQTPKEPKRPSRKYRRRPKILKSEYYRRQKRGPKWLETHVWHAKRFHMKEKWGWKIPLSPTDKGTRFAYRATTNSCIIFDLSYWRCLELRGLEANILRALQPMNPPECGPSFGGIAQLRLQREGCVVLYQPNTYPLGAIGPVSFLWLPSEEETERRLWLWSHPSYAAQVQDVLIKHLNLQAEIDSERYCNQSLTVQVMDGAFNKFRLLGPAATAVLHAALRPSEVDCLDNEVDAFWWKEYFQTEKCQTTHQKQKKLWEAMRNMSPGEVMPSLLISLTVRDPRCFIPPRKTLSVPDFHDLSFQLNEEAEFPILDSPLFNVKWRKAVSESKVADNILNERKRATGIPGETLPLLPEEARIPVLLLHQPGLSQKQGRLGYGSGWDLMVPSGWGMAFWISLIYNGARVGGLEELRKISFESSRLVPPFDFPDSSAGQAEACADAQELQDRYFRRPDQKRENFFCLGIPNPFSFPFLELLHYWTDSSKPASNFFILRDHNALKSLSEGKSQHLNKELDVSSCLVWVKIATKGKGKPKVGALVCMAEENAPSEESVHTDHNMGERLALGKHHHQRIQHMKKKRKKVKTALGRKESQETLHALREGSKLEQEKYQKKFKDLCVPDAHKTLRENSQKVIGFVMRGDFSLMEGQTKSLALCALCPLLQCITGSSKVLLRNRNSLHYQQGKLTVLL
ncbi:unnamed protein product [Darwinula stevensoni]|uniref:Uncharacterized protein n=1 Tax=Darwinula stevensoni TaxID=69355 RepID=A0A7R9FNY3_9CRUS|nr:unnamed protein product [Darwinula stevensoni]CAG0897260.1 unnamed protein product [Darwinula stevensoni]